MDSIDTSIELCAIFQCSSSHKHSSYYVSTAVNSDESSFHSSQTMKFLNKGTGTLKLVSVVIEDVEGKSSKCGCEQSRIEGMVPFVEVVIT